MYNANRKLKSGSTDFSSMVDSIGEITKPMAALEKRRAVRVNVQNALPEVLIGHFGPTPRLFRVKSMAEYGCAFYHEGVDLRHEIRHDVQSFLALGDLKIPVISRLLYITPSLVGVQFMEPSEVTRISIRSHFYLEYTAASLVPRQVSPPPGPSVSTFAPFRPSDLPPPPPKDPRRAIRFANPMDHLIEVFTEGDHLCGFKIDLGHEWATVRWETRGAIEITMGARQEISDDQIRSQILSFLRNVNGINPRLLQDVAAVVCTARIEVRYPEIT